MNLSRADLSICGAEPRCAVLASELRGAQVYVLQPSCPCPTLLQILQGSTGTTLQLQLYKRNSKILIRLAIHVSSVHMIIAMSSITCSMPQTIFINTTELQSPSWS